MNTFGLKRKGISTFWLGSFISSGWKEIIKFTLYIKRALKAV